MAPNFYIDSPLDKDFLFQQMKDRLKAPGLLQEIRALDVLAKGGAMADRVFLVPLLVRKIQRTLADRYAALKALDPSCDLEAVRANTLKADASELIWRTAWDSASHEPQADRRLSSIQTALTALSSIDQWLQAVTVALPETQETAPTIA